MSAVEQVKMPGLTEGRIVHYVLPNGQHRPAIVVRVWQLSGVPKGYINLQVFTDGANDTDAYPKDHVYHEDCKRGMVWITSTYFNDQEKPAGSWHWIEQA